MSITHDPHEIGNMSPALTSPMTSAGMEDFKQPLTFPFASSITRETTAVSISSAARLGTISVGPVHRRFGKLQMLSEKIAMAGMQSVFFPARWRPALLRLFGAKVGQNVRIAQKVFIGQPSNLTLENDVVINVGSLIDCSAPVLIGEKVRIGYQGIIITGSHRTENSVYRRKEGNHVRRPVTIERGCWVQSRGMISPGVTMAEGCTLLANGVLTKSTLPNGEYAGLPARRMRDLSTADD